MDQLTINNGCGF